MDELVQRAGERVKAKRQKEEQDLAWKMEVDVDNTAKAIQLEFDEQVLAGVTPEIEFMVLDCSIYVGQGNNHRGDLIRAWDYEKYIAPAVAHLDGRELFDVDIKFTKRRGGVIKFTPKP